MKTSIYFLLMHLQVISFLIGLTGLSWAWAPTTQGKFMHFPVGSVLLGPWRFMLLRMMAEVWEGTPNLTSLLQAFACFTYTNILLSKKVQRPSPKLRVRDVHSAHQAATSGVWMCTTTAVEWRWGQKLNPAQVLLYSPERWGHQERLGDVPAFH